MITPPTTPTQGTEQNNPSPTNIGTSSGEKFPSSSTDNTNTASPSDTSLNNSLQTNTAIMNPSDTFTKRDDISQTAIDISQKQDQALASAATPQAKTNLLISSAQNNIHEITTNLQSNDFTTTAFLTQRLSDRLTQMQQVTQIAPLSLQNQLRQEDKAFCEQADLSLKIQQLQVSEGLEQDVEVARGMCLNIQQ